MANDFTSNPFIIDTPGATDLLVPVAGAKISITKLRWVVGTGGVAGDNVSVTNSAGKEIWAKFNTVTAATSFEEDAEENFIPPLPVKGLKVPTMSRGKLYVYVRLGG